MKARRRFVLAAILAAGLAAPSLAADRLDEAMDLYAAGHYEAALRYFRTLAADENLPAAYYNIGVMYAKGQGVAQDHVAALSWYRQAADRGHEPALFSIGAMYAAGLGVPQNFSEAATWYRKGAERGDAGAQNALGLLYDKKRGVPQDFAEAIA
ncbi:MAG: sel1 repeat family protein [Alphaproteobacteria bacterium]|nr:sel1 repeat family protein [Alphaproteobacteria bacterium]